MKTILEVVALSSEFLNKKGIKNSRKEALDIVSLGLNVRPLDLYVQFDRPLNESELSICRDLLKRRSQGEPFQYIRGQVEFYDCTIKISPDVLIPRHETEILVDRMATIIEKEDHSGKILVDLCCGSGCIGLSLKRRFPDLQVVLSDISPKALAQAKENARLNHVEVQFHEGDFLAPLAGMSIDYLVCNPPYVSEEEYAALEIEVRNFEPKLALVAEDLGLKFYKQLAAGLQDLMVPKGKVWLEIGFQQGKSLLEIFKNFPSQRMEIQQDWSDNDRFFFLELK